MSCVLHAILLHPQNLHQLVAPDTQFAQRCLFRVWAPQCERVELHIVSPQERRVVDHPRGVHDTGERPVGRDRGDPHPREQSDACDEVERGVGERGDEADQREHLGAKADPPTGRLPRIVLERRDRAQLS